LDWSQTDPQNGGGWITDCQQANGGIPHCSAWSFLQKGTVPMTYNYPAPGSSNAQHTVGLLVSKKLMFDKVTRLHVMDGVTLARGGWRGTGGVCADFDGSPDVELWKQQCPNWQAENAKHLAVENTPLWCVPRSADPNDPGTWNACNKEEGVFEIPVGENGELWPKLFMKTPDNIKGGETLVSRWNSNIRQCEFKGTEEGFTLWRKALDAFYDDMKKQMTTGVMQGADYPQKWAVGLPPANPDGDGTYFENELVMETPGPELVQDIIDKGALLAVEIQVGPPCMEAMDWLTRTRATNPAVRTAQSVCAAAYTGCKDDECNKVSTEQINALEERQIRDGKKGACKVAAQLTTQQGKPVRVLAATYTNNALPDWQTWQEHIDDKWHQEIFAEVDCSNFGK